MVTILPPVESFGSALGRTIGQTGGNAFSDIIKGRQQRAQMQQENAQIKKQTGVDLSGITDPNERKAILVESLRGQRPLNPLQEAQMKLAEARTSQAQGQTGLFQNLLGGGQSNFGQQLAGDGQQQSSQMDMQAAGQPQQFDMRNPQTWSEDQVRKVAGFAGQPGQEGVIGNIAKQELERRKDVQKQQKEEEKLTRHEQFEREKLGRHEETEISKPVLIELNQMRKNIPLQEQAIIDIKQASPNVSALDYFADVTGFEPLRTAEGAKLKTGIKDFFLSDLTRVGARPNQWIEQQLADALPKIGRSTEANLITAEGLQFKLDLAKKRIELVDKLAEEDRKKFGFVKGDIDSRAYNQMKKFVVDRQKELQENIKKIKTQYKGKKNTVQMTSPDGSLYEILSNDIDEAIENGFNFSE